MSIGHVCNKGKGVVLTVCDGNVTFDQWSAHARLLSEDPEVHTLTKHILDLRFATVDASIGEGQVQEVAHYFNSPGNIASRTIAIVAGGEFTNAKHFERLLQSGSMSVIAFNMLGPACAWVGIDPLEAEEEINEVRARLRRDKNAGATRATDSEKRMPGGQKT